MVDYLDNEGEKIQKGFYSYPDSNNLIYFTGEYNRFGFPIFEKEERIGETDIIATLLVKKLCRISKEEIKVKVENLKEKINWLEKGLQD